MDAFQLLQSFLHATSRNLGVTGNDTSLWVAAFMAAFLLLLCGWRSGLRWTLLLWIAALTAAVWGVQYMQWRGIDQQAGVLLVGCVLVWATRNPWASLSHWLWRLTGVALCGVLYWQGNWADAAPLFACMWLYLVVRLAGPLWHGIQTTSHQVIQQPHTNVPDWERYE